MIDPEELRYGILDLYEKTVIVLKEISVLGPSMIAWGNAMKEYDPKLAEIYERHLEKAKSLPEFQGISNLLPLLAQAIQILRARGTN